jgi:serine protease Do
MPNFPEHFFKDPKNFPLILSGLALCGVIALGTYEASATMALKGEVVALTQSLGATAALSEQTSATLVTASASQDTQLTTAVANVAPAVVSIVISKAVPKLQIQYENPFGDDPRGRGLNIRIPVYRQVGTQEQKVGAGTGFIVRQDGYIVTNRHVVGDTSAQYTVLLSNGQQKTATVVYRDAQTDLAIIKIDGSGYQTVPLGDSSNLQLGQTVAAIGNALGEYSNSVSVGIISGLNRSVQAYDDSTGSIENLKGVVQTDAAINLGNSGGPLFDLSGAAVGVNVVTAVNAQSIAFAIPINSVKDIISRVL